MVSDCVSSGAYYAVLEGIGVWVGLLRPVAAI